MLKKLEELYLSFNRLTGELPVEICRYSKGSTVDTIQLPVEICRYSKGSTVDTI
jgi:hypothetical protein